MKNHPKEEHRQTVGKWLSRPFVWRIPVYQRHYAWDARDESGPVHLFWATVKEQVGARLDGKTPPPHYLGAVLVDNKTPLDATDGIMRYDVVDGQQRLTTIQIAMLALIQVAEECGCGPNMQDKLAEYVYSDEERNRPRLFPTNFDNKQFQQTLYFAYGKLTDLGNQNVDSENAKKSKIIASLQEFKSLLGKLVGKHPGNKEAVINAVAKTLTEGFDLVLIVLRKTDEAQRVFESLNSVAKPLTTFDLIRNNVFYRAGAGEDERLFNTPTWQNLERPYWEGRADNQKGSSTTHIEAYVARTLVAKRVFPNTEKIRFDRNSIFNTYKEFARTGNHSSIDEEIKSLAEYAAVYQHLDSDACPNPVAGVNFGIFRHSQWKSRDFYPVLFVVASCGVDAAEKQRMIKLLESYVIRRSVCGLSIGAYNKYAALICKEWDGKPTYQSLRNILAKAEKDSYVFPDDKRVEAGCVVEKFYKSLFQRHVFEEIEKSRHGVKVEKVVVEEGELTIDHILPQKWETNPAWRKIVLGDDADGHEAEITAVNAYLHTIGNLTLMSGENNSTKSNRPLEEVQDLLAESAVKLNRDLAKVSDWNAEKITARSKSLAAIICKRWPRDIPSDGGN